MDLKVFNNENFGEVRTVVKDSEVWFVAKDVIEILELSDVSMSLTRLSEKQKLIQTIFVSGQNRNIWTINESGLYKLAFTSRKPEAEKFTDWVTSEVLPSIRKTGSYLTKSANSLDMFEMALNAMREQERQLSEVKESQKILETRLNNLDNLTLEDKRQKLGNMVKKYAYDNGLGYAEAWKNFKKYYNQAFETNLTLKIKYYKADLGIKNLTTPEYLERTDKLDDAIRVADKMLNV